MGDERIRNWLKIYSNWPTYPQVFLEGKFVGGVDIVTDLIEAGEFDEMVPASCKSVSALEEWQQVLISNKVVALIQGDVDQPLHMPCQDFVAILKRNGVQFTAVDADKRPELLDAL